MTEENMENESSVYLISDLAALTGLSHYTIEFYIKLGLVTDIRRTSHSRYRLFGQRALEELRKVMELRRKKVPLKEIKERMNNGIL